MRWVSLIVRPSNLLYALGATLLVILQVQLNTLSNLDVVALFGVAGVVLLIGCLVR